MLEPVKKVTDVPVLSVSNEIKNLAPRHRTHPKQYRKTVLVTADLQGYL